ncbi:MAG: response regulator, partial [Emergencia sp.]
MIYFVEDDNSIRELVLYTLNNAGYEARGFERPSLFWDAVKKEVPRLILLDIMLPEEDGLQILKKLRTVSQTKKVPVMMLTAKGTEYDKVIGLD